MTLHRYHCRNIAIIATMPKTTAETEIKRKRRFENVLHPVLIFLKNMMVLGWIPCINDENREAATEHK